MQERAATCVFGRWGHVHDERQDVRRKHLTYKHLNNTQGRSDSPPRSLPCCRNTGWMIWLEQNMAPTARNIRKTSDPPPEFRQWWRWRGTEGSGKADRSQSEVRCRRRLTAGVKEVYAQTLTWLHLNIISIICSERNVKTTIRANSCFFYKLLLIFDLLSDPKLTVYSKDFSILCWLAWFRLLIVTYCAVIS